MVSSSAPPDPSIHMPVRSYYMFPFMSTIKTEFAHCWQATGSQEYGTISFK